MYRRRDVEIILEIKKLLYQEGFTIAGARKKLLLNSKEQKEKKTLEKKEEKTLSKTDGLEPLLKDIQKELFDLSRFLNQ
jgi:DNA-binding transcriptional MerR regulator